jgi:hypothetical protein
MDGVVGSSCSFVGRGGRLGLTHLAHLVRGVVFEFCFLKNEARGREPEGRTQKAAGGGGLHVDLLGEWIARWWGMWPSGFAEVVDGEGFRAHDRL